MKKIILLSKDKILLKEFRDFDCHFSLNKIKFAKDSIIVLLSYPEIISEKMISQANFLNVHNSLLPKYRGLHAFSWAIINGEKEVGYTLHKIDKGIDSGPIVAQVKIPVNFKENINDVFDKAKKILPVWLKQELIKISKNGVKKLKPQNEKAATYVAKRHPEDGKINWQKSSLEIYNFIRALTPPYTPGAFSLNKGKKIVIAAAEIYPSENYIATCGQVVGRLKGKGVLIKSGDGLLLVKEILCQGKKQPAEEFIRTIGARL